MNIKVPIEDLNNLLKSDVDTIRKYIPIIAEYTKVCKKCGTEFISNHKSREFCSKKCMYAAGSKNYRDRKGKNMLSCNGCRYGSIAYDKCGICRRSAPIDLSLKDYYESIENGFKEVNVPLTWEEIDQIVIALRFINQAFKGNLRDTLEEKMSNYSMKAKEL